MRTNIVHVGAGELTYEIRNIIKVAEKLQAVGVNVNQSAEGDCGHCQRASTFC